MAGDHMDRFTDPISQYFGVKALTAMAGVIGGVVSLQYVKDLTIWRRAGAVISGGMMAGYFAPWAVHYIGAPAQLEAGAGFFIGLFGMSAAGAGFRIFDRIREDPLAFWRAFRGK